MKYFLILISLLCSQSCLAGYVCGFSWEARQVASTLNSQNCDTSKPFTVFQQPSGYTSCCVSKESGAATPKRESNP